MNCIVLILDYKSQSQVDNPGSGTFSRLFGNSKILSLFNNAKLFEETKNKNDTNPNLEGDFCSTAFLSKSYGYAFFIGGFPYGCRSAIGRSMSVIISLTAGTCDDIVPWLFKGTMQISVFRQNKSGLIWTILLKRDCKTTPCFSRPLLLQPNPSFGIFFYLPNEETFKTHKNIKKNFFVHIQIKILNFS